MAFTLAGLKALLWIPHSISTVVFGLRVFVRIHTRNLGLEDYLIILCWLFATATAVLAEANLEAADPRQAGVYLYYAHLAGILSLSFGKASITIVLLHLIERAAHWRERYLKATLGAFTLSSIACLVANIIPACSTQKPPYEAPICLHYTGKLPAAFAIIWSVLGAFLDISYSVIAWTIVWSTQMSRRRKTAIAIIFGVGWTAAPFSILRPIVSGFIVGNEDLFWLSTSLEVAIVIIGASISFLMPLIRYLVYGKPMKPEPPYPPPNANTERLRLRAIAVQQTPSSGTSGIGRTPRGSISHTNLLSGCSPGRHPE